MKKSRFTEAQIVAILKELDAGTFVAIHRAARELRAALCVSRCTRRVRPRAGFARFRKTVRQGLDRGSQRWGGLVLKGLSSFPRNGDDEGIGYRIRRQA